MRALKQAEKMGLNIDDLMQMTVLDAILLIEDTRALWKELSKNG